MVPIRPCLSLDHGYGVWVSKVAEYCVMYLKDGAVKLTTDQGHMDYKDIAYALDTTEFYIALVGGAYIRTSSSFSHVSVVLPHTSKCTLATTPFEDIDVYGKDKSIELAIQAKKFIYRVAKRMAKM